MAHVARGDTVVVTKGRDAGKRGKVKSVYTSKRGKPRVEIEKVNMVKRHTRPSQKEPQGGIVDKEGTVALANVALWCEKCAAGRRSVKNVDDKGRKFRACYKCGAAFPSPGM